MSERLAFDCVIKAWLPASHAVDKDCNAHAIPSPSNYDLASISLQYTKVMSNRLLPHLALCYDRATFRAEARAGTQAIIWWPELMQSTLPN